VRHPQKLGNVSFGSWSCKNPRGLGYQRFNELAKLTPIGSDYALIAAISGWVPMMFITRVRL
jgi:hypothetical protein